LKSSRIGVPLIAVCLLLANAPLVYVGASGATVDFSNLILFFVSRHVLCLVAVYPASRYGLRTGLFAALFIVPSLLLIHGMIIWKSNGMLELWPPILFIDVALFSPALILHNRTRRWLGSTADAQA